MSVSNSRHSLAASISTKAPGKRWRSRIASFARSSKRRSLQLESLERRELMASDLAAIQHNSLIPTDVNGDFDISPVDALQVINALNRQSRGALTTESASASMYDVNDDGSLSPIDALMVINQLKTGEGVGELAAVGFQVLNASGTPITPTTVGGISQYTVAPGEKFTLRTQARDLRPSASGVFSAYTDINYATQGSATTELAQVLWSEVQTLRFAKDTNGGTFTLTYGAETTAPITFSTNAATTRTAIKNAVGALSVAGGASNVNVTSTPQSGNDGPLFDIYFIGSKVRQNVTDATVGSNNLTVSSGGSNTLLVNSVADPADKLSLSSAITFPANQITPTSSLVYNGGVSEATLQTIGTTGLRINDAGNFANSTQAPAFDDPSIFLNVFDTAFQAASTAGIVDFTVGSSENTRLGVALYGEDTILADSVVTYPASFQIVIATDLAAVNDSANVAQDSGATPIVVGANDIFKSGTTFSIDSVTQPASGGSVAPIAGTTNNASAVNFTPTAGFSGTTTFTYTIKNDLGATSTATVTVTVSAPNNPPVALTTPLSATEAGPAVTFTPVQLFSPGNNEGSQTVSLSNVALVAGAVGSISIDGSGNVSYTPPADDFFGSVLFTVTGTDNFVPPASTTATFTIAVADVNDAPLATATSVNASEDAVATILASNLFTPGPGNEVNTQTVSLVSATAVSPSTSGTIAVNGSGNAVFTPVLDFVGTFIFVAIAQDNGSPVLQSSASTVTINVVEVNDPPVAVADTGAAQFTALRIVSQPTNLDVMRNDNTGGDPGDAIRITAVTQPASGTVAIGPNGSVVIYTPAANTPIGSIQSFTYTITDNGPATSTATAEVLIEPPSRPFAVDDSATVSENGSQIIINVLANDFANVGATKRLLAIVDALNPSSAGTLVLLDNGTPSDTSDDTFGFTPTTNFTGSATFSYSMDDTSSGSVATVATVVISVGDTNDPPTVINQTVAGVEDTILTIPSATVLAGSSPGPGESEQTLTVTAASVATVGAGSAVVTAGNVVFTPAADFNGQVLISYTATDNGTTNGVADPKSASATITVNVTAVNDAPTATATSGFTTVEDSATPLTINASSLFSPGPSNESTQTLALTSATAVSGQTGGTIVVNGGNAVFTPSLNFNGTFTFVAIAQDNGSPAVSSQPSTITINVTPVNDAPVPVVATRSANATIPTVIDLTAELAQASRGGGADEVSQTVQVNRVISLAGTRGTISLNANGTISYVAPAGFSGPDTFDYEIIDNGTTNGNADPKTGIARITINVAAFVPSSISGQVWVDDDMDGAKESDELRLGEVEIVLTGRETGASSDITPIRKTTHTDGSYTFDGLSPGTYLVTFTPPSKLVDAPAANSVTQTILAPGGTNSIQNFSVYGFEAGYNGVLDNLESSYYLRNGQQWREKGFTALVLSDGSNAWTVHHGGFEAYQSSSVRIGADGVYLTLVLSNSTVIETKIPRNMYLSCRDVDGNTLLRILATPEQLTFSSVPP